MLLQNLVAPRFCNGNRLKVKSLKQISEVEFIRDDVQKEIWFSFLEFRSTPVTFQTSFVSTACGCCHDHSPSTRHRVILCRCPASPGESMLCLTCSCTWHDVEFHPGKSFTLYNPENKALSIDIIDNNKIVLQIFRVLNLYLYEI